MALDPAPRSIDDYLNRTSRLARRRIKHAKECGYTFTRIDPHDRIDEILTVNRSASERQGRPMHPHYFDEETVRGFFAHSANVFGVVDAEDVVQAYITVRVCGEVAS